MKDLGFFDDRWRCPTCRRRPRPPRRQQHTLRQDGPITILTVMGIAMQRLSLGATFSTTYFESFHVARVFATLDLMTEGRAAWNIVTSMNDGEALNMGHTAHSEHDRRYDRADEFMEVVMGHRDAWDDGAIVADRTTGSFAHPEKVHRLDHKGEFFQSRGPFTVPRF
jgi:alkanesulfonate monooxygenase SsuD/methylene tetrahydromethanopterin reductase-like flavin-dependent oxidoreductase (luciferase family)